MPTLFIARRFLRGITKEQRMATMLIICMVTITLSTFALTLIIAIANGLHEATTTAIKGFHSDCTLQAPTGATLNFAKINATLKKEFSAVVAHASPVAYHHAIIQHRNTHDVTHVIMLQGIDPTHDAQTRPPLRITAQKLKQLWHTNTIIIGATLSRELRIKPGDQVTLLFATDEEDDDTIRFSKTTITVNGIFNSGIDAVDERMVFCSLQTLRTLFPETGISHINIKLTPSADPQQTCAALKQRLKLNVVTWHSLYPALLDALALERKALLLIVFLVAAIASIATIALLLMYLTHQQTTLAILRTMGMSLRSLRTTFTIIGTTITMVATTLGLVLAALASWVLEHYKLISLPDVYYINYVPAHLDGATVLLVFGSMILVSLFTSWWTTGHIKKMNLTLLLKR